jgi:hypothetical protein
LPVPDAAGLELIRRELNDAHSGAVLETSHDRGQGALSRSGHIEIGER